MSNFANRIVRVRWTNSESPSFLAGIKVGGFDDVGIVNKITKIISNQHKVNMRSINFDTKDSIFEGNITIYVQDTNHLEDLIKKIKAVNGVISVERMN
jgi:GTP pyrophosphokinase